MATAPSTARAGVGRASAARIAVRRLGPAAAVSVAIAALAGLVSEPWYLIFDARCALLWARDLADGARPDYLGDFAPTPHPLQTAVSVLALPLGEAADDALAWLSLLCLGVLVTLVGRLGAIVFTPAVGVVAACVVATRPALVRDAVLAYQDVPFAALVVAAVAVEARAPRRGSPVLALLALAGLLRPEAWALSALYLAWLWRGGGGLRVRHVALALAAPVLWTASDWAVSGDALRSWQGTAELADAVGRRTELADGPYWAVKYVGFVLREPIVAILPLGAALAWRLRVRAALLPAAVLAALLVVFLALPALGLPQLSRYVRTPAVLLAPLAAVALCAPWLAPAGRERRLWVAAGAVSALVVLAFAPRGVEALRALDRRTAGDTAVYGDVRAIAGHPAVRRAVAACAPLTLADRKPLPYVRWWLGTRPGSVRTVEGGAAPLGRVVLAPRRGARARHLYPDGVPRVAVPARYVLVAENRSWRVRADPSCLRRPPA